MYCDKHCPGKSDQTVLSSLWSNKSNISHKKHKLDPKLDLSFLCVKAAVGVFAENKKDNRPPLFLLPTDTKAKAIGRQLSDSSE